MACAGMGEEKEETFKIVSGIMQLKFSRSDQEATLQETVSAFQSGGIVALPTDTVYGFAVALNQPEAAERLYAIKERPHSQPTAILIGKNTQLDTYLAPRSPLVSQLCDSFWPGNLTCILPSAPSFSHLCQGDQLDVVGVRWQAHPFVEAVINALGVPLVATSANRRGTAPCSDPVHLEKEFGNELALIVADPDYKEQPASTVIRITHGMIEVCREGALPLKELTKRVHELSPDTRIAHHPSC